MGSGLLWYKYKISDTLCFYVKLLLINYKHYFFCRCMHHGVHIAKD